MSHIYIAYHRDDSEFVAGLIRQLEDGGFRVWSDHARLSAETTSWRESIDQAIRDAFALLVVITPAARASEQVNYEWMFALGTDIPVIPVILEPAPLHPRQEILTSVDFTDPGSPPWGKLLRIVYDAYEDDNDPRGRRSSRPTSAPPWRREGPTPMERMRRANASRRDSSPLPPLTGSREQQRQKLLDTLNDDDRDRRQRAAHRLGELGDRSTIPALIKLLRDDEWRVREAAASALAKLDAVAAVPALLETLRQTRPGPFGGGSPNKVVVSALREIGPAGLPVLIDALSDDNMRLRLVIVDLLGEFGDTEAVPALVGALHDPESRVRWRAADALGKMGSHAAVPELLRMLSDSDNDVRISAAWALGQIGHPSALKPLFKMLNNREWRTRWAAAQALWTIGDAAIPGLIARLHNPNDYVRHATIHTLAEIGDPAVEALIATLRVQDWDARWGAASALQTIGAPAVPALIEALNAGDWQAGWAAAETLKRINTREARRAVALWQDNRADRAHPDADPFDADSNDPDDANGDNANGDDSGSDAAHAPQRARPHRNTPPDDD
jgi:HEAT repeat protein